MDIPEKSITGMTSEEFFEEYVLVGADSIAENAISCVLWGIMGRIDDADIEPLRQELELHFADVIRRSAIS